MSQVCNGRRKNLELLLHVGDLVLPEVGAEGPGLHGVLQPSWSFSPHLPWLQIRHRTLSAGPNICWIVESIKPKPLLHWSVHLYLGDPWCRVGVELQADVLQHPDDDGGVHEVVDVAHLDVHLLHQPAAQSGGQLRGAQLGLRGGDLCH